MSYLDDDDIRVYIASAHSNAEMARALYKTLKDIGCEIVSKWTMRPIGWSPEEMPNEQKAVHDLSELQAANVFVGLMTPSSMTSHAEFGYALARGIPCFVVPILEPRPGCPVEDTDEFLCLNMLMYHPDVHRCGNEDEVIRKIHAMLRAKIVACDVCGRDMTREGGMLYCRCGAQRERSPMAWKDELIRGHQAFCSGVPIDKGDHVACPHCRNEWTRQDDGMMVLTVADPEDPPDEKDGSDNFVGDGNVLAPSDFEW